MPSHIDQPAIQVKNLRFAWQNKRQDVLYVPKLEIAAGQHFFVRGASGSGKSTLLSLLAGVNLPTDGEINILGQRIDQLSGARRDRFRADHIGIIFQLFNLIPYLSVLENVTLPCHFSSQRKHKATSSGRSLDEEAIRLLRHLDITDKALFHQPVTELSVGQQQRVAAARALIGSPEIIIADEPTSALDSDTRQAFIRLLFNECQQTGTTLVFVSHDQQLQPLFEQHIHFEDINHLQGKKH